MLTEELPGISVTEVARIKILFTIGLLLCFAAIVLAFLKISPIITWPIIFAALAVNLSLAYLRLKRRKEIREMKEQLIQSLRERAN